MIVYDQLGNEIELERVPRRIVSLVPSQTELLYYLEVDVIGITKFCIHPEEWFQSKKRVGGTKNLAIDKIRSLHPDLIIANKEENSMKDILKLQKEFNVYVSDIYNFEDAFQMISDIAQMTDREEKGNQLIQEIQKGITEFPLLQGRVIYLIWQEPFMAVGPNTFIGHVIDSLGLTQCFDSQARYPELTMQDLQFLNPDIIFLSSEPFPFKEKHKEELASELSAKIILVDGEIFSWYGSRMLQMAPYFKTLEQTLSS